MPGLRRETDGLPPSLLTVEEDSKTRLLESVLDSEVSVWPCSSVKAVESTTGTDDSGADSAGLNVGRAPL